MTTTIVEARSLAPVLQVAADPPFDPVIAIPNVVEPLILYIAKVPGSKDVFLTPIKPRDRTITAEDISRSIYFLHVHGPEDDALLKKPPPSDSSNTHPTTSAFKKQLPSVPSQAERIVPSGTNLINQSTQSNQSRTAPNHHPLPPVPAGRHQWPGILQPGPNLNRTQRPPALNIARKPVRKPVLTSSSQLTLQNQFNVQAGNRRKPGAPGRGTPFTAPYPEDDVFPSAATFLSPKRETFTIPEVYELPADEMSSPTSPVNIRRDSAAMLGENRPSPMNSETRRDSSTISSFLSPTATSTGPPSSSLDSLQSPSVGIGKPESKEYQFTLIRRDPVTSQQWNVATIYSHASTTRLNEDQFSFETTPNWMNIVMETPGYHKFNKSTGLASPSHSCADLLSPMMSAVGSCAHDAGHTKFHRHLQMEFSKLGDLPSSHSKVLSQDRLDFGVESGIYGRSSGEFVASQMSLLSPGLQNTHKRRTKRTGYAFRSPWDGRCEFSSATGHSTLKCKHAFGPSLLSPDSASPNQISELRYNLPSMPPPANNRLQVPNNDSLVSLGRTSQLNKLKNRFSRSTSSLGVFKLGSQTKLSSASTLDLSLGQERAGGGFSGNHSKLGKLIIENEGLKMMDLLVAANMSVWWKSYEKR